MGDATLFRGPAYGALAVACTGPDEIVTIDHGIEEEALDAALTVLDRLAEGTIEGDGVTRWTLRSHPARVTASIEGALRRRGYERDPLAERAALQVSEAEAARPDLPSDGKMSITESVASGFHSLIHLAERASGLGNPRSSYNAWPRPNVMDAFGRPLPFLRAVVEGDGDDPERTKRYLRDALSATTGLVRVTAESVGDGQVRAEVGVAFPREVIDEFAPIPILGPPGDHRRTATFSVESSISESAWAGLVERAQEAGAVVGMTRDDRIVTAEIPCNEAAYMCLSERIRWLDMALTPWGGEIEEVV